MVLSSNLKRETEVVFSEGFQTLSFTCVFVSWQTITKVLLQYCALLAKSFPSYCEKEKIVSTVPCLSYYCSSS